MKKSILKVLMAASLFFGVVQFAQAKCNTSVNYTIKAIQLPATHLLAADAVTTVLNAL